MNDEKLKYARELKDRIQHAKDILSRIEKGLSHIDENGSDPNQQLYVSSYQYQNIALISLLRKDQFFPFTVKEILQMSQARTLSLIKDLENEYALL